MNPLNLNLFFLFSLQKTEEFFSARIEDDNTFEIFFEDTLKYEFCENNQNVLTLKNNKQKMLLKACISL